MSKESNRFQAEYSKVLIFIASTLGGMMGMIWDPLVWVLIATCTFLGFKMRKWYFPLFVSAIYTTILVLFVYKSWQDLGVAQFWVEKSFRVFYLSSLVSYLFFSVGRAFSYLFRAG